ncbi:hypothetical protein AB0M43_16400 [Longispora sp. NPDC051575]|uniref:hypothetical protein n=1 Tax=Longispora sp. NPDC051575 TaxID=3154943 RepID=UPI00343720DB
MFKASPAQISELGQRIVSFVDSYRPDEVDALIFVDEEGRFGFSKGPDAPVGCRAIMNRAGIDRLMVLHTYVTGDFADPGVRESFAALVCDDAWLS